MGGRKRWENRGNDREGGGRRKRRVKTGRCWTVMIRKGMVGSVRRWGRRDAINAQLFSASGVWGRGWGLEMIKAPMWGCGVLTCTCISAFFAASVTRCSNINSIYTSKLSPPLLLYVFLFKPPPKSCFLISSPLLLILPSSIYFRLIFMQSIKGCSNET